jgi:hypothetical protein
MCNFLTSSAVSSTPPSSNIFTISVSVTIYQIKAKLDALLRKNKTWFSESFVSLRNGHYTVPIKRQHKNNVAGSVIDLSQTGGTCFIEPVSVGRLQSELSALQKISIFITIPTFDNTHFTN